MSDLRMVVLVFRVETLTIILAFERIGQEVRRLAAQWFGGLVV